MFKPIRPTETSGGGRSAGDNVKGDTPGDEWVRCYICGFIVNATVRTTCPFCESDNFRGGIIKTVL